MGFLGFGLGFVEGLSLFTGCGVVLSYFSDY